MDNNSQEWFTKKGDDQYQKRLQHHLELQSQQIERVLSNHHFSAHVSGGRVQPRSIHFDLTNHLEQGWERLRNLTNELKSTLNVPDVQLTRANGQLRLQITRPKAPPVALLDLLPLLPEIPPVTATLGLGEDGRPVMLDFANPDLTHVLLVGNEGAGKTTLLRTMALSLALNNKQSQFQILIIDFEDMNGKKKNSILEPLTFLPHMLTGISYQLDEAMELFNFLRGEMEYRVQQEEYLPTIVLIVDNADIMFELGGEPVIDALTSLLLKGANAGIHLVLSVRNPQIATLNNQLRANLPIRIVGQVIDDATAANASGVLDTKAEHLMGQGDFLAVVGGETTHFQAAYIGDYDLHMCLEELYRNRPRPLLAYPVTNRAILHEESEGIDTDSTVLHSFYYDGQGVELEIDEE